MKKDRDYPLLHWKPKPGRLRAWLAPHVFRLLVRHGFAEIDRSPFSEKPNPDLMFKGYLYNWFLKTSHADLPLVAKIRKFDQERIRGIGLDDCARFADPPRR
jgi:hypothetical protein